MSDRMLGAAIWGCRVVPIPCTTANSVVARELDVLPGEVCASHYALANVMSLISLFFFAVRRTFDEEKVLALASSQKAQRTTDRTRQPWINSQHALTVTRAVCTLQRSGWCVQVL